MSGILSQFKKKYPIQQSQPSMITGEFSDLESSEIITESQDNKKYKYRWADDILCTLTVGRWEEWEQSQSWENEKFPQKPRRGECQEIRVKQ